MATVATKTIQDLGKSLDSQSAQTLILSPITLPTGRTLTDWASFTLTIREDPLWDAAHGGRYGRDKNTAKWADPEGDGWTVKLAKTDGTVVGSTVEFALSESDTNLGAGLNRYTFDVWGIGGTAGKVKLVPATWLSVNARDMART